MKDLKFQTAGQVMNYSNSQKDEAFQCNRNSGFQMDINGFRISVQFGPGNYVNDSNIRYRMDPDTPNQHRIWGTDSAEVMIWDRNGNSITWDNGNQVVGWCKSDTVARFIGCLINCPQDEDPVWGLNQIYNAQV